MHLKQSTRSSGVTKLIFLVNSWGILLIWDYSKWQKHIKWLKIVHNRLNSCMFQRQGAIFLESKLQSFVNPCKIFANCCTFGFPGDGALALKHLGILWVLYDFWWVYVRLPGAVVIVRLKDGVQFHLCQTDWEQRHSGQNVPLFSRYITHQRRRFQTAPSPKTSISMQTESPSRPSRNSHIICKTNIAVRGCCIIYLFTYRIFR